MSVVVGIAGKKEVTGIVSSLGFMRLSPILFRGDALPRSRDLPFVLQ